MDLYSSFDGSSPRYSFAVRRNDRAYYTSCPVASDHATMNDSAIAIAEYKVIELEKRSRGR